MSQKLPGITFWLFLLCFGQILKKAPVPDNFQLTIYKLKLPGTSYILKVQPLPGNSMLTYSKLGIARNLLHFLEIVRNHFHFWRQFLAIPSTYILCKDIFSPSSSMFLVKVAYSQFFFLVWFIRWTFPSDTYIPFLLDHYMNLEIHLVGPYESIKRNMFLGWLYVSIKSSPRAIFEKLLRVSA